MSKVRRATHAGSWYTRNGQSLNEQLSGWLAQPDASHAPARAIIAPHAGYSYCGACSGFAYRQIDPHRVKRVFILGPSHHVRLSGCALSSNSRYQTPFYDLTIDNQVYEELFNTGLFEPMSTQTDEDEHSLEMHLPYIAKVMESKQDEFTIVPVLVGSLSIEKEQTYGRLFSHYLADPSNVFVISSDFCHWGHRFRYTYYDNSCGEIWQSIQNLDKMAMDAIETMEPAAFSDYLKKYQNTICGRHPIGVLLQAVAALRENGNGHQYSLKFVKYAQSSQCRRKEDSSVSYASASLCIL